MLAGDVVVYGKDDEAALQFGTTEVTLTLTLALALTLTLTITPTLTLTLTLTLTPILTLTLTLPRRSSPPASPPTARSAADCWRPTSRRSAPRSRRCLRPSRRA